MTAKNEIFFLIIRKKERNFQKFEPLWCFYQLRSLLSKRNNGKNMVFELATPSYRKFNEESNGANGKFLTLSLHPLTCIQRFEFASKRNNGKKWVWIKTQ